MENEDKEDRGFDGKFKRGNKGGPGGKRAGSGRPPKPSESLLKKLYGVLEKSAPKALKLLEQQLDDSDAKVSQMAAKVILGKVLPERSMHETWRSKEALTPEDQKEITKLFNLKRQQDLLEGQEEEGKLRLVKDEKE